VRAFRRPQAAGSVPAGTRLRARRRATNYKHAIPFYIGNTRLCVAV